VVVARRCEKKGAGEITFLDIIASLDDRETIVPVVGHVASEGYGLVSQGHLTVITAVRAWIPVSRTGELLIVRRNFPVISRDQNSRNPAAPLGVPAAGVASPDYSCISRKSPPAAAPETAATGRFRLRRLSCRDV